jgi:hypothetical protein
MRPMPSPRGSNRAKLFVADNFPRATAGAAYDGAAAPQIRLARACRWLAQKGYSAEDIASFVEHMTGGGEAEALDLDATASKNAHNAMEQALRTDPEDVGAPGDLPGLSASQGMSAVKDALRIAKPNGMPNARHAMDEALAAVRRIGRGPIGY